MASESVFDWLPEVLTIPKVADFLGVCERTVRREVKAGRLECFRVGRVVRFTREQLENYVRGNDARG